MLRLLSIFLAISFGQKKPQDLPYSIQLFWFLMFAAIILDVVNLRIILPMISAEWGILTIVSHSVIYYSCLALLLLLMGFSDRINQTINSTLGCGLIISLLMTPLYLIMDDIPKPPELPGLPVFIYLALNIWMLFINAHILRHALSIHFVIGFILSLGFFILSMLIGDWFVTDLVSETTSGSLEYD